MNFKEFVKGMKKHFDITLGVNNFLSATESDYHRKAIMNIIEFDAWLHEKHGDYEEDHELSMKEIIEKEYGKKARRFVEEAIGI